MNRKNFGRNDLLLILCIFTAAVLMLAAYSRYMSHEDSPMLEITVDNRVFGTYDLKHDTVIKINDTNVCEIKDGAVRMISADCPDQICVHSVPITANGGSIVCLPNRVVLKIINADSSGSSHASRSTGTEGKNISSGQDTAGIHSSSGQGTDKNSSVSGQETDHSDSYTEDTDSEPSSPEIDTLAE